MSKKRGDKLCADWLAACLRIGWSRDDLDALEKIWHEFRDEHGNLLRPSPQEAG